VKNLGFGIARRCARLSSFALLLGSTSVSAQGKPETSKAPLESADACVDFQNDVGDHVLSLRAQNSCERKLSCSLEYTVSCLDASDKQTTSSKHNVPFRLASKGSYDLSISAQACKQGWQVHEMAWTCS
jgi:hypothetical protein